MADQGVSRLLMADLKVDPLAKSGGNHPFWKDEPLAGRMRNFRESTGSTLLFDEHYACGRSGDLYGPRSGD